MTDQHCATPEQQARDMLDRMGVPDAQSYTSGNLTELANLIAASQRSTAAEHPWAANPEDWLRLYQNAHQGMEDSSCILELRARVEALDRQIRELQTLHNTAVDWRMEADGRLTALEKAQRPFAVIDTSNWSEEQRQRAIQDLDRPGEFRPLTADEAAPTVVPAPVPTEREQILQAMTVRVNSVCDLLESDEADGTYTPVPQGQQPTKCYVRARVIPCYNPPTPSAPNPDEH